MEAVTLVHRNRRRPGSACPVSDSTDGEDGTDGDFDEDSDASNSNGLHLPAGSRRLQRRVCVTQQLPEHPRRLGRAPMPHLERRAAGSGSGITYGVKIENTLVFDPFFGGREIVGSEVSPPRRAG
ncbi:hypothetical protein BJ912DRAFT_1060681 [Pholiota molesta]|nr:hypothetical protein BJ912DRAFT_1060681 [Pholiota molesta]